MVFCVYAKIHYVPHLFLFFNLWFFFLSHKQFSLILSALSLISGREAGWHLGGLIKSPLTKLFLETEKLWLPSWHVWLTVSYSVSIQYDKSVLLNCSPLREVSRVDSQFWNSAFWLGRSIRWKMGWNPVASICNQNIIFMLEFLFQVFFLWI